MGKTIGVLGEFEKRCIGRGISVEAVYGKDIPALLVGKLVNVQCVMDGDGQEWLEISGFKVYGESVRVRVSLGNCLDSTAWFILDWIESKLPKP